MEHMTLEQLREQAVFFDPPEVFPESWISRRTFSQYKELPRPTSALFFVATDIRVCFFPHTGQALTARKGDVVYIPQGSRYHVEVSGGTPHRIDTYTVNFRLQRANGAPVSLDNEIGALAHDGEGSLGMHFQKLNEAVHGARGHGNALRAGAAFYGLLDAVVTLAAGLPGAYYSIRAGADALCRNWNRNERIAVYAAMCGVSETYFYRCFREWTGQSPIEYRNALRLSNAESMLRHTDMQVREIAEVIGFEDPFYFCRVFAARFGRSPQKYRAALRNGTA